jgi:hypothetical protein
MATVTQVLVEMGRLHMENIELRAANEQLTAKVRELETRLEAQAAQGQDDKQPEPKE